MANLPRSLAPHPRADARNAPALTSPTPLLRMDDLTPEQAPWVMHPVRAWGRVETQAQLYLRHVRTYEPDRVNAAALRAFLTAEIGTHWHTTPLRDERLERNCLARLRHAVDAGRWVTLAHTGEAFALVDWVDDEQEPDGGRWQVNRNARAAGIAGALQWQLDAVYRRRRLVARWTTEPMPVAPEPVMLTAKRAMPPPKLPKPQTFVTIPELGESANAILAKSPTLQRNLRELQEADWKFFYGANGGGSFAERVNEGSSRITLDGIYRSDPRGAIQTLAHEVGHAKYEYTIDLSNKAACLDSYLSDEGAATLKNIEVQREILANGGPDIGIGGDPRNHAAYNRAYDANLRSGDAGKARSGIGRIFGAGERTSNTNQTYGEYYGGWCERNAGE